MLRHKWVDQAGQLARFVAHKFKLERSCCNREAVSLLRNKPEIAQKDRMESQAD